MVQIELKDVSYEIDGVKVLDQINLVIEDGLYYTLVGPTGAGKTTLIALITGLYKPTEGRIYFDGVDVTDYPPNERHCGVMFESYALFPHLNVLDNVSYARHMISNDHRESYLIARELLKLVHLEGRDTALPRELSGGMQQRVALARALMALEESGILILDEPFKALDAGLRMDLRREVKKIAKSPELKLTTIHVTNDMQEAMMGDRIIVLNEGHVQQVGSPREIMYSPSNIFVAHFFSTELNYIVGKIIKKESLPSGFKGVPLEKIIIETPTKKYFYAKTEKHFAIGDEVVFFIRAQYFKARHGRREDKTNNIVGKVQKIKFMGSWMRLELNAGFIDDPNTPKILKIEIPTTKTAVHNFTLGETITVFYPSEYVIVFEKPSESVEALLTIH